MAKDSWYVDDPKNKSDAIITETLLRRLKEDLQMREKTSDPSTLDADEFNKLLALAKQEALTSENVSSLLIEVEHMHQVYAEKRGTSRISDGTTKSAEKPAPALDERGIPMEQEGVVADEIVIDENFIEEPIITYDSLNVPTMDTSKTIRLDTWLVENATTEVPEFHFGDHTIQISKNELEMIKSLKDKGYILHKIEPGKQQLGSIEVNNQGNKFVMFSKEGVAIYGKTIG